MTDWTALDRELAAWSRDGHVLPLWWRDDDAVAPTAALDRLAALSERLYLPVHLAVIPAHAGTDLADRVAGQPGLIPVVHGWRHDNHAPADQKKAEFGAQRAPATCLGEARAGLARLESLFAGAQAMFVPPWNRIAPGLAPGLAALGYRALSTFAPRSAALAAPGLAQINTHIDPIDWRGGRGLVAQELLIDRTTRLLEDRRHGRADAGEPLGLLTHHLVHDGAIWSFVEAMLDRLLAGPARPWRYQPIEVTA